jgi:hypothetical protein
MLHWLYKSMAKTHASKAHAPTTIELAAPVMWLVCGAAPGRHVLQQSLHCAAGVTRDTKCVLTGQSFCDDGWLVHATPSHGPTHAAQHEPGWPGPNTCWRVIDDRLHAHSTDASRTWLAPHVGLAAGQRLPLPAAIEALF